LKDPERKSHDTTQMRRLVVVVPAYNEAERIEETVGALKGAHAGLAANGIDMAVYVVDDGSADATAALAQKAGADRVLRHKVNQGLGAAIRTGLRGARNDGADLVVKFDADLQHDPEDIAAMVQPILADEADVVYGNRFERIEYRMPLVRRVGNRFFTGLMRFLTGWPLRDSQPGIFAVNRDYLEVFNLPGDYNYTQQILLDAFHKGMRFAHVPVRFRKRTTGRSFISLKYPFKVGYQILLVVAAARPMKVFGLAGLLSLLAATALFVIELVLFFMDRTPKPVVHVNAVLGLLVLGLQTFFFGLLAELIVQSGRR
jgi:glycosyltransferase involved in cell wall biosynthesis